MSTSSGTVSEMRPTPKRRRHFLIGLPGLVMVGIMSFACGSERTPRVIVEARVLRYVESGGTLEFQIDWLKDGMRVVYVQSATRWQAEQPRWARDRRNEILSTMKRLTKEYNFVWREY